VTWGRGRGPRRGTFPPSQGGNVPDPAVGRTAATVYEAPAAPGGGTGARHEALYYADIASVDGSLPTIVDPRRLGRVGGTLDVAARGMPYMLGLRRPSCVAAEL
jgi:hypothetical protein